MSESATELYAEDLEIGQKFPGATRTLDAEQFARFAQLTGDTHPIHHDEAYAAGTRFGKCVAHGLLLTSLTALGAAPVSRRLEHAMIALVAQEFRFLEPAFVGDRVTSEFEVVSVELKLKGTTALVRLAVRLVNGAGESLLEGHHTYLLRTRAGG